MIQMSNVYKNYKNNEILINASMTINKGEIVYITGESGCGKSTIIKLLTKEEDVKHGNITIGNINITKLKKAKEIQNYRRQIGIVFQDYRLIQEMTVFENLRFVLEYLGWKKKDILPKINSISNELGITHLLKKKAQTLSGGEQQRVAIARAIINNPKILYADEPTGNLDEKNKEEVLNLFEKINQMYGTTIIIVTHDKEIIGNTDKHVLTISNKRLIDKVMSVG